MDRNPSTFNHTVKLVNTSIANHRALFGSSRNSNYAYYQRQVTFADTESPRSTSPVNNQANSSSLEQEVRNLTGVLNKWVQHAEEKARSRFSPTRNNYQSTNMKSNDQPYDRYPQMPHGNRQYGNTNRDTRFTSPDQGRRNYGSEYRSPTPPERPDRRYTNHRSPSPLVNSRAQYLYAND